MGSPAPLRLVELGPGRGTLMRDALRAARLVPSFLAAATVHLIETSAPLREIQEKTLTPMARRTRPAPPLPPGRGWSPRLASAIAWASRRPETARKSSGEQGEGGLHIESETGPLTPTLSPRGRGRRCCAGRGAHRMARDDRTRCPRGRRSSSPTSSWMPCRSGSWCSSMGLGMSGWSTSMRAAPCSLPSGQERRAEPKSSQHRRRRSHRRAPRRRGRAAGSAGRTRIATRGPLHRLRPGTAGNGRHAASGAPTRLGRPAQPTRPHRSYGPRAVRAPGGQGTRGGSRRRRSP